MRDKSPILIIIAVVLLAGVAFFVRQQKTDNKPAPKPTSINTIPMPVINKVTVENNGFSPSTITVKRGETVMWINKSGKNASVNSDTYPTNKLYKFLNLGGFPADYSVQVAFPNIGTYTYHNQFIPSQKGTVIVK